MDVRPHLHYRINVVRGVHVGINRCVQPHVVVFDSVCEKAFGFIHNRTATQLYSDVSAGLTRYPQQTNRKTLQRAEHRGRLQRQQRAG